LPFPGSSLATAVGFIGGFAAAAIGFGLGQPQIVSRYLVGRDPQETQAAKWIYIGFVQYTWIVMTVFGVILRGLMPDIADPEAGLSLFFQAHIFSIATGIIVADIFATIAATSNSLLIAMAQSLKHDLLTRFVPRHAAKIKLGAVTLVCGLVTMAVSTVIEGTVVTLALSSVSLMGAGLAVPVMNQGSELASHVIVVGRRCDGRGRRSLGLKILRVRRLSERSRDWHRDRSMRELAVGRLWP
jgi:Na+/proline symporter